jgi:hypothetical protein
MQRLYVKQRYRSLVVSFLLHILLLILCLYLKMNEWDFEGGALAPHQAARVTYETRASQGGMSSQSTPLQQPKDKASSIKRPLAAKPLPLSPRDESQQSISHEGGQQKVSQPSSEGTTTKGLSRQAGSSLTGKAFMNAFRRAVMRDRYTEGRPADPKIPAHVEERLAEWGQSHYRERALKALVKAARFTRRYIHRDEDMTMDITITIPLKKDGTVDIEHVQLRGIEAFDEGLMMAIIQQADWPPFPKRFTGETYQLDIPVHVSLKKGSNFYVLS